MFEILGWEVQVAGGGDLRADQVEDIAGWHGGAGWCDEADWNGGSGWHGGSHGSWWDQAGWQGPPRLVMAPSGAIIEVAADDPALAARLAAAGLDRLVPPLNLAALEQLAVLAG
ncbi:hypothetical protein [Sandarakinorhabdus rubra]|uniref:hypothetical protein n=1 Tax=Sandarakinorhabdus rubra TaxID=2672568 RepID=UPI0013DB7AF9|nr:hypothetical protein [Sandarakinorhabdus rubra]